MDWHKTQLAPDNTHHLINNQPLYTKRFLAVQKYHAPGLAPVCDKHGAYHITTAGIPAYAQRFDKSFGFYEGRAAVVKDNSWWHILPCGEPLYAERYRWCGNFQNQACVVQDFKQAFYHIDLQGKPLYSARFRYAGDFRDGIATLQNDMGLYSHICQDGSYLHNKWFADLDVYHKGFARAKDEHGWFHIDAKGQALYSARYSMVEPFYNGYARVTSHTGAILRLDEQGNVVEQLCEPRMTEFQQLSADLVGFWRTQTIKAAVDLQLIPQLPATPEQLSHVIGINAANTIRLLRALQELQLVYQQNAVFYPTERAAYLLPEHPLSLCAAAKYWGESHYLVWLQLAKSLRTNQAAYAEQFTQPIFEWLDEEPNRLLTSHQTMTAYARHDYASLSRLLNFKDCDSVIDAAGGTGSLLQYVLEANSNLKGILLERPKVIELVSVPEHLQSRMQVQGFDLFTAWPAQADVILLSRVLHDWDDAACTLILQQAKQTLTKHGRLIVIEFLLDKDSGQGGMLDLNMLVITGGKERGLTDYQTLAQAVGFSYVDKQSYGFYHLLYFTVN